MYRRRYYSTLDPNAIWFFVLIILVFAFAIAIDSEHKKNLIYESFLDHATVKTKYGHSGRGAHYSVIVDYKGGQYEFEGKDIYDTYKIDSVVQIIVTYVYTEDYIRRDRIITPLGFGYEFEKVDDKAKLVIRSNEE